MNILNDTIRKNPDKSEYDIFYKTTGLQKKKKKPTVKETIFEVTEEI